MTRLLARALPAGVHEVAWDGRDASGRAVSSGAYVAVLRSCEARFSQKLLLIKWEGGWS